MALFMSKRRAWKPAGEPQIKLEDPGIKMKKRRISAPLSLSTHIHVPSVKSPRR